MLEVVVVLADYGVSDRHADEVGIVNVLSLLLALLAAVLLLATGTAVFLGCLARFFNDFAGFAAEDGHSVGASLDFERLERVVAETIAARVSDWGTLDHA